MSELQQELHALELNNTELWAQIEQLKADLLKVKGKAFEERQAANVERGAEEHKAPCKNCIDAQNEKEKLQEQLDAWMEAWEAEEARKRREASAAADLSVEAAG